jgi:hypothetical protein
MGLEKHLHTAKVRGRRGWRDFLMKHWALHLAFFCLLLAVQSTPASVWVQTEAAHDIRQ